MVNKEDGWGTTPEIYTPYEYKNITFVGDKECQLFAANKIYQRGNGFP